jgi:transcriptional regulator with XRE-family HTH domain
LWGNVGAEQYDFGVEVLKATRGRSTAEIDAHVGARIRQRRIEVGLSQRQLAEMLGITNGLLYKYERGLNRVRVSMLYEIARKLEVPIIYFYDGLAEQRPRRRAPHSSLLLETTSNFAAIKNRKHREAFSDLVRVLAEE